MVNLPALSESITVPASADAAWARVTDLRAMARRSPELVGMWVLGRGGPDIGRVSINLNRRGWFAWPTLSRITDFSPPVGTSPGRIAFTVWPTDVEWSYEVHPEGSSARLVEARTPVVDPSWVVRAAARIGLGGQVAHEVEIAEGIRTTLANIEADLSSA